MNHSFKNTQNAEQIAKIYQRIKDYINQPAFSQEVERPVDQEMFSEMIRIVLSNLNNQQMIENYKEKLTTSQLIIFNQLLTIYHNFKKSKEELTKYCIRNAFKYLGERVNKKSQKEAYEACIQQYFGNSGFHLPYKKYQTSFKSMNSQFLRMLFKSPKFAIDFEEFLSNFKKYAMMQNERKIALLIDQIQFPLKDELNLGRIRRIPWPIDVINQSINIGSNLLNFSDLVPKSQKNSSQTDEI